MAQLQLFVDLILQNRYQITRQLGRGGMGAVYEATDLATNHLVAIKQLLPIDPELQKAFRREATILSQIDHANLPRALDYFENETGLFLVMEFVPGQNLGELLTTRERIPFASHQVKRWAEELFRLLIFLHTQPLPIIHRDLKPANLKLTPQGHLALLDFGLAKELDPEDESITNICMFGYTPHYAPLEQIQGESTNTYSDIYALGATLYHLLTGVQPTDALKRANDILCKKRDPLPHLAHVVQGVPQSLASLVMKALSLAPSDRPRSASQMLQQLQAGIIAPSFRKAQDTFTQPNEQTSALEATYGYPDLAESTVITTQNHPNLNAPQGLTLVLSSAPPRPNRISVNFQPTRLHLAPHWSRPPQSNAPTASEIFTPRENSNHLQQLTARRPQYATTINALIILLCVTILTTVLYHPKVNPLRTSDPSATSISIKPDSHEHQEPHRNSARRALQTPALFIETNEEPPEITIEQFLRNELLKLENEKKKKARQQKRQTQKNQDSLTNL